MRAQEPLPGDKGFFLVRPRMNPARSGSKLAPRDAPRAGESALIFDAWIASILLPFDKRVVFLALRSSGQSAKNI